MSTLNLDTMTLSVEFDQLTILPEDGLAMATIKGGSVLLNVKPQASEPKWFMLSPTLTAWLARQLSPFTDGAK